MHFLASNSSLEDMLDKVFSGQTNQTKPTDLPDHSYAWLGETVGGLVTLLTLVIAVVIVWKKNAESVGRILTALQSLLQEKVTRFVGFSLREKILLRDCHALRVEYPLTEKARKFTFRRRTRIETRERIRRINP